MYVPHHGRFLSRDPLFDRGAEVLYDHAYVYAHNNPINRIDPSGLQDYSYWIPDEKCLTRPDYAKQCREWGEKEARAAKGWLNMIGDCPCSIGVPPRLPERPAGQWRDLIPADQEYHWGATWCMRGRPAYEGGPGQQCCYDEKGKLITGGTAAGTPDKIAPAGLIPLDHHTVDVVPFGYCKVAGRLDIYLTYRPPNNGLNCPTNILPK